MPFSALHLHGGSKDEGPALGRFVEIARSNREKRRPELGSIMAKKTREMRCASRPSGFAP